MDDKNQILNDILEIVNFLKDNATTKQELNKFRAEVNQEFVSFRAEVNQEFVSFRAEVNQEFVSFRAEVNQEFKKVREEIIDHVDGFVGLHQHQEIELAAVAHKTDRLENYIYTIARHLQLRLDSTH